MKKKISKHEKYVWLWLMKSMKIWQSSGSDSNGREENRKEEKHEVVMAGVAVKKPVGLAVKCLCGMAKQWHVKSSNHQSRKAVGMANEEK